MHDYTDIHICEGDLSESLTFPGPKKISPDLMGFASGLAELCRAYQKDDFLLSKDGLFFRCRREKQAVSGIWYRLRRMPSTPPTLETLKYPLSEGIRSLLLHERLKHGGLVYIVGAPGQGKTTTASATLISRLHRFGGFAYTVEDPPEMPLNGWHGAGYCAQTSVSGDHSSDWAESFRGILRSQPSGTPSMLYVGEVRDAESARALIRAAMNGFLVIATGFGTDIITGIDALAKLEGGSESMLASLSSVIRLVIHQRLMEGRLVATSLASANAITDIAAKIRVGNISHLVTDIQFQANQAILGLNVFNEQMKK